MSKKPFGSDVEESESFNASFEALQEIAESLNEQQNNPDIDALVHMVESAVKHYQVCKNRIDVVEKLIHEKLEPLTKSSGRANAAPSLPDDEDDDGNDENGGSFF